MTVLFCDRRTLLSAPNSRLVSPAAPGCRAVAMTPMLLRRRMSRRTRTAVKFVGSTPTDWLRAVSMFSAAMS